MNVKKSVQCNPPYERRWPLSILHNTLQTNLSPLRIIEGNGLMTLVPILTALLLSSLNDFNIIFLCVLIRSLKVFVRKAL